MSAIDTKVAGRPHPPFGCSGSSDPKRKICAASTATVTTTASLQLTRVRYAVTHARGDAKDVLAEVRKDLRDPLPNESSRSAVMTPPGR